MPSSMHQHLAVMVGEIIKTQPKTILDIGVGFGKWGYLTREYLETHFDRVYPDSWQLRIDGVEAWERYIKGFKWLSTFYNRIFCGDIYDLKDQIGNYDLIIAGDIIEHLEKEKGIEVLKQLIHKARKKFLLSIPLRDWLNNKIVDDNPYESHRSVWYAKELIALVDYPIKTYAFRGIRGDVGVFVYEKEHD